MNWIYSIAFQISGLGQISAAEQAVQGLENATDQVGESAERAGRGFQDMGNVGQRAFARARSSAATFLGTLGLVFTTLTSINAAAQDDATNIAIDFATSGNGVENIAFINELTDRLGINLFASKEGFKQLAGSLRGTNMEGQATRDIFEGVAMAGGAMRLSSDQIQGAYLAIGQIASKGKVQAEELRGQLGERIPGAFKIAADAMGVTQTELDKMLETGKVTAEDFLPKFAAQLRQTFGKDAMAVAEGPAAAMARFQNAVLNLQIAFGQHLLPTVTLLINDYLIPGAQFIAEHIELFGGLAAGLLVVVAAIQAYNLISGIASIATVVWQGAVWLLNAAFWANPITWVVAAIVALVATIVHAWKKFEGFRAFIMGMWSVIKELGQIIYDYMVLPFMSLGKLIVGALTFDKEMVASGTKDAMSMVERMSEGIGNRVATAFYSGYAEEIAKNPIAEKTESAATAVAAGTPVNRFGNTPSLGNSEGIAPGPSKDRQKGLSGITGRGATKNITISLENLVGEIKITSQTIDQGVDEMVQLVTRKLLQVINTANQVQ